MKSTFSEAFRPCPEHQDDHSFRREEQLPRIWVNKDGQRGRLEGGKGLCSPCPECKALTQAAAQVLALANADKKTSIPMPKWRYQQKEYRYSLPEYGRLRSDDPNWWNSQLDAWMVSVAGWH